MVLSVWQNWYLLKVKLSMCMLDLVGSSLEPFVMNFTHYMSSINVYQKGNFTTMFLCIGILKKSILLLVLLAKY